MRKFVLKAHTTTLFFSKQFKKEHQFSSLALPPYFFSLFAYNLYRGLMVRLFHP